MKNLLTITLISLGSILLSVAANAQIRVCKSSGGDYYDIESGTSSGLPFFILPTATPGMYDCSPIVTVGASLNSCVIELPRSKAKGTLYTYSNYTECSLDSSYSILILIAIGGFGIYKIREKNL